MKFKKWMQLQEVGTSTSCIAGFSRMTLPMVRRMWSTNQKKKVYMQPQVKEESDPREGSVCPHCGSTDTSGARTVEKDKQGNFVRYANTQCRSCDNGYGFSL